MCNEFQFHTFGSLRLRRQKDVLASLVDKIEAKFSYFEKEASAESTSDLVIDIGPFDCDPNDAVIVDKRYFINEDGFLCSGKHKIGTWMVAAEDLSQPTIRARIQTNLPGTLLQAELIEGLLRYRFGRSGYPVVHACAFSWRESGVLFSGRGAIGKTTTAVRLLEDERAYILGDNWIPLNTGVAYPFPTSFNLWTYNLSPLVWSRLTYREKLRYYVHLGIGTLSGGFFRPFFSFPVASRFPERVGVPTPIKLVCLLLPSSTFRVHRIDMASFIDYSIAINQLDSRIFTSLTMAYRCVHPHHQFSTHWDRLAENLRRHLPEEAAYFTVHIPREYGPDSFRRLIQFVEKQLDTT